MKLWHILLTLAALLSVVLFMTVGDVKAQQQSNGACFTNADTQHLLGLQQQYVTALQNSADWRADNGIAPANIHTVTPQWR